MVDGIRLRPAVPKEFHSLNQLQQQISVNRHIHASPELSTRVSELHELGWLFRPALEASGMQATAEVKNEVDRFTGDRTIEYCVQRADREDPEITLNATIHGAKYTEIAGIANTFLTMKWLDPISHAVLGHVAKKNEETPEFHGLDWLVDGQPYIVGNVHALRFENFGDPCSCLVVHAPPRVLRTIAAAAAVHYRVVDHEFSLSEETKSRLKDALSLLGSAPSIEEAAELEAQRLAEVAEQEEQLLAKEAANVEIAETIGKVLGAIILAVLLFWFLTTAL